MGIQLLSIIHSRYQVVDYIQISTEQKGALIPTSLNVFVFLEPFGFQVIS